MHASSASRIPIAVAVLATLVGCGSERRAAGGLRAVCAIVPTIACE